MHKRRYNVTLDACEEAENLTNELLGLLSETFVLSSPYNIVARVSG